MSWASSWRLGYVWHTPSENAANEVYEETGLPITCEGLVGVYDMRLKPIGASPQPTDTLVFDVAIQEVRLGLDREEFAREVFRPDQLPVLQAGAAAQVFDALRYHGTDGDAHSTDGFTTALHNRSFQAIEVHVPGRWSAV